MDAGEVSPFMVLVSPTKRCGKTSVMILLQYLTPRSELAGNITAPALFRYIEAVRPTLLIDEADSFVKDNEELRGILNSGHTKVAANVIRNVEVNGEHKPRRFSTWAPKAIATIRSLADTLEDRAIIVQLQRKPPGAKVERLRRRITNGVQLCAARPRAGNLSYSHMGSDASTLRKPGNGAQSDSATTETPSDNPGDIPEGLVRTGHRCNNCGSQFGLLNHWAWPGYPDGIRLHPRCEEAWHDGRGSC